jgi:hypothetical protein
MKGDDMKMTYQLISASGSFWSPCGTDVVHGDKRQAALLLDKWIYQHAKVGAADADAELFAFIGDISDVSDMAPDYEIYRGKRGGTVWSRI